MFPTVPPPSFEISKEQRTVMLLSEADVKSLLDPGELLDALEDGFRALAAGKFSRRLARRSRSQAPGSRSRCRRGGPGCRSASRSSTSSRPISTEACRIISP